MCNPLIFVRVEAFDIYTPPCPEPRVIYEFNRMRFSFYVDHVGPVSRFLESPPSLPSNFFGKVVSSARLIINVLVVLERYLYRRQFEVQLVLSPQWDLRYNMGGAVNTLTQMGTTCALVLLVNVTRPSLLYGKG